MGILISCLVMYLAGIVGIKYIINDRDREIDDLKQKNQALESTNQKLLEKNCDLVDKLNELEPSVRLRATPFPKSSDNILPLIKPKPYQEIDEKEELLNHAFSAICNLFYAAEKANYSKCASFHIDPFNAHWDKKTVTEVMAAVKLYVGTWVITPMEEALKTDRENIKNYQLKLIKETIRKRVRWYPKDTDETYDGTVIDEKPNFYIIIPDQNLELQQNWNKKYCEVI